MFRVARQNPSASLLVRAQADPRAYAAFYESSCGSSTTSTTRRRPRCSASPSRLPGRACPARCGRSRGVAGPHPRTLFYGRVGKRGKPPVFSYRGETITPRVGPGGAFLMVFDGVLPPSAIKLLP